MTDAERFDEWNAYLHQRDVLGKNHLAAILGAAVDSSHAGEFAREYRKRQEEPKIASRPAADPWIKIEPGCEMPENDLMTLLCISGIMAVGCYSSMYGWWANGTKVKPTHYAVVRRPEAE